MPRSRAYGKGLLRLSLVTIGVHVHNAVESKSEISFRQIHKPTGRRVNYQKTVSGVGRRKRRHRHTLNGRTESPDPSLCPPTARRFSVLTAGFT
jgi:hypothetical protein